MQLLEHWDPLNLPRGSVRALITLTLLGILWSFLLLGREVPLALAFVTLLVLGHYFGSRASAGPYTGRPPLFLPRGSIRLIIVLGFAVVGYYLWEDGRLRLGIENRDAAVMLLALGLITGYIVRKLLDLVTRGRATAPRRWFENLKAILALMATAAVAIVCVSGQDEYENIALLVTPFIAFYFGSREGWRPPPPGP